MSIRFINTERGRIRQLDMDYYNLICVERIKTINISEKSFVPHLNEKRCDKCSGANNRNVFCSYYEFLFPFHSFLHKSYHLTLNASASLLFCIAYLQAIAALTFERKNKCEYFSWIFSPLRIIAIRNKININFHLMKTCKIKRCLLMTASF